MNFYLAEKGKGAYFNQKRIGVSEVSDLSKSYIFYCEGGEKERKSLEVETGDLLFSNKRVHNQILDLIKNL